MILLQFNSRFTTCRQTKLKKILWIAENLKIFSLPISLRNFHSKTLIELFSYRRKMLFDLHWNTQRSGNLWSVTNGFGLKKASADLA